MDKSALQTALLQVERLQEADEILREHIRTHIDAYTDEAEMIYILAILTEVIQNQLKLASMIAQS